MGDPTGIGHAETVGATGTGALQLVAPLPTGGERYRDEGTLGQGGMGVVSLHLDRRIGRRVAVKHDLEEHVAPDSSSWFSRNRAKNG